MKTIYKYPLTMEDTQTIELPYMAQPLCVKQQKDGVYLWAMVNPECATKRKVTIRIFGTGEEICVNPDQLLYIDTIQTDFWGHGTLVFHYFIEKEP